MTFLWNNLKVVYNNTRLKDNPISPIPKVF